MSNPLLIQQFQLKPLVVALCLGSLGLGVSTISRADDGDDKAKTLSILPQDRPQNNSSNNLPELNADKSQDFFKQYYVERDDMANLPIDKQRDIAATCRGTWVTPIDLDEQTVDPNQATSVITADYAYYDPDSGAELKGNVNVDQPGRSLQADQLTLDNTQTIANATGNVRLMQAGLLSQSDAATYNLKQQTGEVRNSLYISENQRAHGTAQTIIREGNGITRMQNAIYSTCEPDKKLVWKLQAKDIELNENTGRGITRHTKLYVKDVPILSVPYFNFPIDDRRTSGFLVPNFGYSNIGGARLAVPYYFNLAPNYDLTLAPMVLSRRGLLLDGEYRYLTQDFGGGNFSGGYLAADRLYDADRKSAHYVHDWQIDPVWHANVNVNYVSDKDYFADFNSNPVVKNILNQERTLSLAYNNGIPGLTGLFRVQSFQTIDPATADVDKPYARLPQLLLNYRGGNPLALQYAAQNDTAYFKKSIDDGSALENSGTRIFNRLATSYTFANQWGFVRPELSVRSINTFYDKASIDSQGINSDEDKQRSVAVPQFTLDSSFVLEKDGRYLQSLTPRLFYAYAPYHEQSSNPNFDTTSASLNYDQLFNPYRFYGNDRLEDNNFASLGVTYRAYDTIGLERFRLGIGQSYYFSDRKVRLNSRDPIATSNNSGIAVALGSQLSPNFSINGNSLWLSDSQNSQNDVQLNYTNESGNIYNASYYYRRDIPNQNQQEYEQITAGFVQPLHQQWRLMGYMQYDLKDKLTREWLLGLNYDACCWAASLYGRTYYNDLDDPTAANVKARHAVMMEISLKGLAGFSGNLNSLLKQKILGYQQVETLWKDR